MKLSDKIISAVSAVLFVNSLVLPMAQAAISPGQEQERMELSGKTQESSARIESPKDDAAIEVGDANVAVSDETTEKAIGGASAASSDEEEIQSAGSYLSEASDEVKITIKEIRIPEDAPISKYEMETLIQTFEARELKLSEVIYLTENISQLYSSARLINQLNIIKEGFNDSDNAESITPTTFVIDKINVPDNAAISQDEVEALVKPYEGKELTLNELRAFTKNLDKVYLSSENINAIAEGDFTPMVGGVISSGKAGSGSVAQRRAARKAKKIEEAALPTEDVAFLIEKIEFSGNTVVPSAEIQPLIDPFKGKTLKLSDAKQIALSITQLYRSKGYITCRAYIPPQKLSDKLLKIQIFEGKLGKIKVQGNKYFNKDNVKRYLRKLKGKVMQYSDLEKDVRRANLHPDREVKAVIVPGKSVGTSDLILDVEDRNPIHIGGEINNFGTKLTGKERYSVSVRHTNLFGIDDVFATRVQFGDQVFAIGAQYAVPVGDYDTQIGGTFNYTDVDIAGEFSILDLGGKAYAYSLFINQPFYDGKMFDLTWTNSFESKSIENTILDTTSSEDEIRMLHTGLNVDEVDRYGRTFLVNDFAFGIPWLGGSEENDPRLSRAKAGAPFFKYTGALNRIHPVRDYTYLFFKGAAQFSPDRLVSAEQFDLGGVYSVRGYPQSDYLGDYGATGSAEIRVPFYFIPRNYKASWTNNEPLWNKLNFVGFVDGGHAGLKSPAVGEAGSHDYWGVGAGLRFDLPHNLTGRVEWAAPIGDDPVDGSNGQFYFTVSGDLV